MQLSLREHNHSWDPCAPRHSSAMLRADISCSTLLMLKGGARASRAGGTSASRAAQAELGQDLPQIPVNTAILSTGTLLCCSGPEAHVLSHSDHRAIPELDVPALFRARTVQGRALALNYITARSAVHTQPQHSSATFRLQAKAHGSCGPMGALPMVHTQV